MTLLMRYLFVAGVFLTVCGCKTASPNPSGVTQIFIEQQRDDVTLASVPYIISVGYGCTGFIIDVAKDIAISAAHCGVEGGAPVCHGLENTEKWALEGPEGNCQFRGIVHRVIESSAVHDLDYAVFEIKWEARPNNLISVKLAKTNQLKNLLESKSELRLVGYPSDKYRKFQLTTSRCRVRDSEIRGLPLDEEMQEFNNRLLTAWKEARYKSRDDYLDMRNECWFIAADTSSHRPSFTYDCSVYGGNSGGPVLAGNTVVGMPASYFDEPTGFPQQEICFEKYWDTFFRPVVDSDPPEPEDGNPNWDKLNRESSDLADFPVAIPMYLIVERSKFLLANRKYLAE
jgi:hypothetical protein